MGLNAPKIYLDTCVVIYLVERHPLYSTTIESRIQSLASFNLCYTSLVRMECLIKPYRTQDSALLQLYETYLGAQLLLELSSDVFDSAAQLRANHPKLKTPDAIHLAAAQHHGCAEFWTNDDRLNSIAARLVVKVI